jgi:hypothetical protein
MQGIYTYIPETEYGRMEYSVAAILLLLFMVLISLAPVLNLLYFYVSTFRSICAVSNRAVFCSSLISCFPGMLLTYILNDFEMVAPIITGINFVFNYYYYYLLDWVSTASYTMLWNSGWIPYWPGFFRSPLSRPSQGPSTVQPTFRNMGCWAVYPGVIECSKKLTTHLHIVKVTVKVNFTLEQATKAQRGSRSIALLFL